MRLRAAILTLGLLLASSAAAHADTYCVGKTGCDHDVGNDLQLALNDAAAHPGDDTVKVGPLQFSAPSGFTYGSSNAVHIEGDGGVARGRSGTTLGISVGNPSSVTVLRVSGTAASTVSGIDVEVPGGTGTFNLGVVTNGTLDNVLVEGQEGEPKDATGVQLDDGGSLVNSRVLMTPTTASIGVLLTGEATRASDSRIEATEGLATASTGAPAGSIARVSVSSSEQAVSVQRGTLNIEDSTFESRTTTSSPVGLIVNALDADAGLTANHVTIVGSASPNGIALYSQGANGHRADLVVRNSVITQYPNTLYRSATFGGEANLTTDYSDYGGVTAHDSGAGSITETHRMNASPGFLTASDAHLRADSPLIDAGDPAGLAAGESTTDASGQPRVVDGDGDCSARRDIGAYEFQPGPRAPHATASAAPGAALTGQPVTFDSAGSCDPDADALTYSWTFDDGGGAPGASVGRTFSSPGLHFGTVTVTDSTGRSATATAAVRVAFPPFSGVTIGTGKFRASKKGSVKLKLSCPAGTSGLCAGTLGIDGAKAAFSIPPGAARSVTVKLSKSKLTLLRRRKTQKLMATAVAHDANGTPRTSTAKLTLLAPR